MDQHKKFGTCKRTRHKLFQKRGHYSRGNIIQGRTLFKGGHYLKKYGITYHPKGCPRRTFANDPVFVFCHIRGCRLRSPFFCSSLECTVLLTSSCSTRARWTKEVLVRQCFAFGLCYVSPKLDLQCLADLQTSLRSPHTRPIHGLFRPSWAKWCSLGKALKARAPFGLRAKKATSSTDNFF